MFWQKEYDQAFEGSVRELWEAFPKGVYGGMEDFEGSAGDVWG